MAPFFLLKTQICHHYTNRHGDWVKSLSYWYYTVPECMLITFYCNFQEKKKLCDRVDERLHLFWMIR